jgi:hypothetical protein
MTDVEIEKQLRELLWSYRNFYLWDLDEKGFTADEQKRLENKSKLAWDTLKAAFGSRRELTEAFLKDSGEEAEAKIQQQLKLWTESIQWPGDSQQSGWLGSAETVEEYNRKTYQFLTGTLWPFIKVIRSKDVFDKSSYADMSRGFSQFPSFEERSYSCRPSRYDGNFEIWADICCSS